MNFRDLVAGDPLSTALDRAVASAAPSVGSWEGAAARAAWDGYTPAERASMVEYWAADRENVEWNARITRNWHRKLFWSVENGAWRGETDEEYRVRTASLKWRPLRSGFEFIPSNEIRRAA
jgi:hypothetical protein